VVPNGIPLSKIHHAAFDAHLIGIDADYRLHVSERLLTQNDGPMLEALKRLHGGTIHLPNRPKDLPDRDRLASRFERFMAASCPPPPNISRFLQAEPSPSKKFSGSIYGPGHGPERCPLHPDEQTSPNANVRSEKCRYCCKSLFWVTNEIS
jgi:hypothetical protein